MEKKLNGAILQRDKETYAIVLRTPVGLVSAETLKKISDTVLKHKIPLTKITSGQRLTLIGIHKDDVDTIWQELQLDVGRAIELCLHYVQACPGTDVCVYGQRDSLGMGKEIEDLFYEIELPAKLKIGVSGCPFCCAESYVRDIGVIGKNKGWTVTFGGNSGGKPRIADVLAENISRTEVIELLQKSIAYYKENGKKKERTARFIQRTGIEKMKQQLGLH